MSIRRFLSASRHNLSPGNRWRARKDLYDSWLFSAESKIEEKFLCDLFPDELSNMVPVDISYRHVFELDYGERTVLSSIISAVRPRAIFEIGTFRGGTTKMITGLVPDGAVVHTLDLPDEQLPPEVIGQVAIELTGHPGLEDGRLKVYRCNSREFDFTPFSDAMDIVIVDGDHSFEGVVHDSAKAMDMVSKSGVVIWDDYRPGLHGVVRALNEISRNKKMFRVFGTAMVLWSQSW